MVQIKIANGQGITQAIKAQITSSGGQISNNNLSVWQQVMTKVKTANNSATTPFYTGGDNVDNLNNRQSWQTDFKVMAGQTFEIADNVWNEIKSLLTGQPTPEETIETTPEPKVQKEDPINVTPQEDTPIPEQSVLSTLPKNAKQQIRDIVNVGESGSKETVAIVKDKNGVKCYYQVETNPQTGEVMLGRRLAADTRGLRQDEYYTVDDTIGNGAEVDTDKTVDGKKDVMTYTIKEDDQKKRYTMIKNDDGTYRQGEQVFDIIGSNRFISKSSLDAQVKEILGGAELPKGVDVQVLSSNGTDTIIFKKDGQRLSGSDLKALLTPTDSQPIQPTPTVQPVQHVNGPDNNQTENDVIWRFITGSQTYITVDGRTNCRGHYSFGVSHAHNYAENTLRNLYRRRNEYIALLQKDTLSPTEQNFVNYFKKRLDIMELTIDANGNFANAEGSKYIRE